MENPQTRSSIKYDTINCRKIRTLLIFSIQLIEDFNCVSGKPFHSSTCFLFIQLKFVEENWSLFAFRSIARVLCQVEHRDHKMQLSTAVCRSYARIAFRCLSQVWTCTHDPPNMTDRWHTIEKLKERSARIIRFSV